MDKKLTELGFPSEEVLATYNEITPTEDKFFRSLDDPEKALAVSSSVVSLRKAGIDVTAEQLELDNGKTAYSISTDGLPPNLTIEDLESLVDVTDKYHHELQEDQASFVLKEDF